MRDGTDQRDRAWWDELLGSLEADLVRRGASERDHPAWLLLGEQIAQLARVLVRRYDAWSVDPEDVTQEVLLGLYSLPAIRRLRAARSADGYLAVVVKNRVLDELRRNRSLWRGAVEWEQVQSQSPDLPADVLVTLHEMLDELSEEDWELIRMRFWQDLTIEEIADRLDVKYSTASVRLFRLLRKLRDRFKT